MKTRTTFLLSILSLVMVFAVSCFKDDLEEQTTNEIEYNPSLYVIDSTELSSISSFDTLGEIKLPSSEPLSAKLQAGMIITGGISNTTPYGFLKKITKVTNDGSVVTITTKNATFEDAFINASINFSKRLTINDIDENNPLKKSIRIKQSSGEGFFVEAEDVVIYDYDGNPATEGDQIKADGSIYIDPTVNLSLKITNRRIEEFKFAIGNELSTELTLFAGSEVLSREAEYSLVRIPMNPIYIQAGLVPIVAVPVLEITAGAKVEVNLRVETSVKQSASLEYGIEYSNGSWQPVNHSEYTFENDPPRLSASTEVKGYFGPQFNLLFYGVAGPYTDANLFLKLKADVFDTPWWSLYGGGEIGVGVQVDVLGHSLADFYAPNVLQYQQLIDEADGGAEGIVKGLVKDAFSESPLQGVTLKISKESSYYGETQSESDGQFSIAAPACDGLVAEFTKEGYIPISYHNINVTINNETYLEPVLQIDNSHSGNGSISGTIYNAIDGSAIAGCNLDIRNGINATQGTVIASAISNSNGTYLIQNLPAGNYTIHCYKNGFTESFFTALCLGGQLINNQNGTMTPVLNDDEIRIVLTWGDSPSDLDSHLTGPADGDNRFHVFFASSDYYQSGEHIASLDHDDVSSYGPETVTLYHLSQGVYRYSVHDYTNKNSNSSWSLSNSNAQVRVYQGSSLLNTFNVPANVEGTLWTVFELVNDQINPVNSLTYESNSGAVTSPGGNDGKLLIKLPVKTQKTF